MKFSPPPLPSSPAAHRAHAKVPPPCPSAGSWPRSSCRARPSGPRRGGPAPRASDRGREGRGGQSKESDENGELVGRRKQGSTNTLRCLLICVYESMTQADAHKQTNILIHTKKHAKRIFTNPSFLGSPSSAPSPSPAPAPRPA